MNPHRRGFVALWCSLFLWLAASTVPLPALHHSRSDGHGHSLFAHKNFSSSPRTIENTVLRAVAPSTIGDICEETEETEDALESDLTSSRLSLSLLESPSTLLFTQSHGIIAVALYILHHSWKHFLPALFAAVSI